MDWVTLSRADVESDGLPRLCAYCGRPSRGFTNKTFEWHPEWIQWMYFLGILPGAILHAMHAKKMRVSLPVCDGHANLGMKIGLVGGLGWLLLPALCGGVGVGGGALAGWLLELHRHDFEMAMLIPGVALGVIGLIVWLVWIVRLASRQIDAKEITDDGIRLEGVAHEFVMAVKAQAAAQRGLSERRVNAADLELETIQEPPPADGFRT